MKTDEPIRSRRLLLLLAIFSAALLAFLFYIPGGREVGASSSAAPNPALFSGARPQLSVVNGGKWDGPYQMSDVPVHISLLPNGKLLYWARDKNAADGTDIQGQSKVYLADPLYLETAYTDYTDNLPPKPTASPTPTDAEWRTLWNDNTTTNLFCSGHSFLPDGRLLIAGGHKKADKPSENKEGVGDERINIYDYLTERWSATVQKMEHGRWYPFNVTLGNGETLIMSGTYWDGTFGSLTGTATILANKENNLRNLQGGLQNLAGDGNNPFLEKYPYISMDSTGKVLIAAPLVSYRYDPYASNPPGQGVYSPPLTLNKDHIGGTSVMYAPNKVIVLGGYNNRDANNVTNTAESIDLNEAAPAWRLTAGAMAQSRIYATATILPDGKVLITGGTSCKGFNNLDCGPGNTYGGAVQAPELWDPDNPSQWTQMNSTNSGIPRVYHSIALLMPDARVMIGGGGLPAAAGETAGTTICKNLGNNDPPECKKFGHKDVEFFSPPYLFNSDGELAVRPAITSAPSAISYGQTFSVGVGNVNPSNIDKVVLIRLPSVTHTYNQDQRRVVLPFSSGGNSLNVTAPISGNDCPPGPYMMFLVSNNGRGTPSIARIVRVGDYSINSTSQAFPAVAVQSPQNNLSGNVSVTAAAGVNWVAEVGSGSSWITITSGSSGFGNGMVGFQLSPNNTGARREGSIRIRVPGRESRGFDFVVYQSANFSDVTYPTTTYFDGVHRFISNIYARGITAGCGGGAYCTDSTITRAQVSVFLTTLLGPPTLPTPLTQRFADVSSTNPYRKFIEYVTRKGIAGDCGSSKFCPDAPLTRKDMVVWLLRARGITQPPSPSSQRFNDVPLSDPAAPYVEEAYLRGITAGCGGGNFCPDAPLTRGQMAVFFVQTFGL